MPRPRFPAMSDFEHLRLNQREEDLDEALARGFDIDTLDDRGETLLLNAAYSGEREWAQVLLSRGANPNIANPMGNTAIMIAVFDGRRQMFEILMRHGAKLERVNNYKHTVISGAMECQGTDKSGVPMGQVLLARMIELGVDLTLAHGEREDTLLHEIAAASVFDGKALLPLLEKRDVDVNVVNIARVSALHMAVKTPATLFFARWLIERGADVDAITLDGTSVDQLCCEQFQSELAAHRARIKLNEATPILASSGSSRRF